MNCYFYISSFVVGLLCIYYGNNIKHRKTCVICGANQPCLFKSCKPVGIEGNILYNVIKLFYF